MPGHELRIDGMTCDGCAEAVQRALEGVEGVEAAQVSFASRRASTRGDEGVDEQVLIEAVEEAGYGASRVGSSVSPFRPKTGGSESDDHLVVVGGGSAAFAATIRAAELGARVTMIECGVMGGTCVNVGCVPSKTLIRAAETYHRRNHHPFAGVPTSDGAIRLASLVEQKAELVDRLRRAKYQEVLAELPAVEYLIGEARFLSPTTLRIDGADGTHELDAERIVLATGSSPWIPPIPGLEEIDYWTNVEALAAEALPERLLVIGGAAVGAELAQLFARLGSRVTVVEMLASLVPNEDPELGSALQECLEAEGLEVLTSAKVSGVERAGDELRIAVTRSDDGQRRITADHVLVATGRRGNLAALDLAAADVATADGFIEVDERMRTSQPHIYAAGDCATLPQFVYVAAKAGTIAAENALRAGDRELDLSAMPAVTFTDPQVASVGLTEAEAQRRGLEVDSRTLSMEHVPRALANRDTRGLVKLVAERSDRRVVGVHVLSPLAGEVIQTGVLAVRLGVSVDELVDTLFPYLTEVEGLRLAAQTFDRRVVHLSCCAG